MSMHKNPTPVRHSGMNQARSEEEEKERKRDRKDRGQEADGKKSSPTKQNTSEELKQGLPGHRLRLTKLGEERWTIPSHRMWPTAPDIYKSKRIFSFAALVKFSTYISILSKLIVNYTLNYLHPQRIDSEQITLRNLN